MPGQKVWANSGDGKRVGFILEEEGEVEGYDGLKAVVQIGANPHVLAYRELKDDDERGSGGTFWLL